MSDAQPQRSPEEAQAARMAFTEHLGELRTRLRNAVAYLVVATGIAWAFRELLFAVFARPLVEAWRDVNGVNAPPIPLNFTNPMDGFMVFLKCSVVAAVFVSSPLLFLELWKFVAPGLYARERRMVLPFITMAVVLFVSGGAFAYFFVLPKGYAYFLSFANNDMGKISDLLGQQVDIKVSESFKLQPMISIDEYFSLTTKLLLVFGLVFELPLVLSILAAFGIVTAGMLWRFNRYALLLAFVAGAVLTPGDLVVGQVAMGGALTVLYNISILIALLFQRKRARVAAAAAQAADSANAPPPP